MMGFFADLAGYAGQVADIAVQAAQLLALGAGIKHIDKVPLIKTVLGPVTKRIPNDLIPFVNLGLDLALGGGGLGAAGAGLLHQGAKILSRRLFGDRAQAVQEAVGPGSRLSI